MGNAKAAGARGALAAAVLAVQIAAGIAAGPARAEDVEAAVRTGLALWRGSGCPDCHGAFADGEKQRDEMPSGANLRRTRLDATGLRETIACGRPGTGMPSFDDSAWKVRPCNGAAPGARPDELFPAPVALSAADIDAVVAYLQARVIGKGSKVSKQECLAYYTDDPGWCDDDR